MFLLPIEDRAPLTRHAGRILRAGSVIAPGRETSGLTHREPRRIRCTRWHRSVRTLSVLTSALNRLVFFLAGSVLLLGFYSRLINARFSSRWG